MITVLVTILHIIVCFVLILVILLQAGRGQGLAGASFGSGNVQSLFGTRAGDFLTKATSVSAICFLLTCIGLNLMEAKKSRSLLDVKRKETAPVDIEAIKKALEQVKKESAAKADAAKATVVPEIEKASAPAKVTAQNPSPAQQPAAQAPSAPPASSESAPAPSKT